MDVDLRKVLESKRAYRRKLASLPPAEKLRILDQLRTRARVLKGQMRADSPSPPPLFDEHLQNTRLVGADRKRPVGSFHRKAETHRFGGRATAGGVNYEVRVAAVIAVKMLSGSRCCVWDGIDAAEVSSITMQAPEPVDDIVVSLRGDDDACVFISAKERSGTVTLSANGPAFTDTIDSFVRQFLKLSATARFRSRLVWAIPSHVGRAATRDLPLVLDSHRMDSGDTPLSHFVSGREAPERKALEALHRVARAAWKKRSGILPTDEELRHFLRQVYVELYDFGCELRLERQAESDIRSHVVADPRQAHRAWDVLERFFAEENRRGVSVTPAVLRRLLTADGLKLKSPPDYAEDIARLAELTTHNLTCLKDHTTLPFGPTQADAVHIARTEELTALAGAAKAGHLLITGEPGCGKSGLICALIEGLHKDGFPVVLLLAEEMFGRDSKGTANLLGTAHPLDKVLATWPSGARGYLVTDALDAVRDVETQGRLRRLLREVREGESGWTVIASVREFDLKHGRELRELFPGNGVTGHCSHEFAGVAHFHLKGLSEGQLDDLAQRRSEIRPFVEGARKSLRSGAFHRSPFYLRLAAELLRDGVNPARLADWNSPAMLLRKFWAVRIRQGAGANEREIAIQAICRRMVCVQSMTVSLKELSLGASERNSIDELRSRDILQTPALRHGALVGGDEIRFTHHLLYDYGIAKSLVPETRDRFCDFVVREPLLPVFYRQSILFALEELWDLGPRHEEFWETALQLEQETRLYGITRILAPVLAARRVESLADLQPLLEAVESAKDSDSFAHKAMRHLASGLEDADGEAIRSGAGAWCGFAERLASLLPTCESIERPLALIVDRLNAVGISSETAEPRALNAAARGLLAHHARKEVSKGWPFAGRVAIEAVCRTFAIAPAESEGALLGLLAPQRLAQFPHGDLNHLAENLKHLGDKGETVVLRLFEAAFADEPQPGQWEPPGSQILRLTLQSSDQWRAVHYLLANYYAARTGANAALMTEAACIAWNAAVRRREGRGGGESSVLATIQFRGVFCKLVEDYSHIWGRDLGDEENQILSHFEKLLGEWAANDDAARLDRALDCFARSNRTSLMWGVYMEAGAEHPSTLGVLLQDVLNEPLFLSHPDYSSSSLALFRELHRAGDPAQRERLEKLVLGLPKNARLREEKKGGPIPSWVIHAQNRLLGALEESNIELGAVRDLWHERRTTDALVPHQKSGGSDAEVVSRAVVRRHGRGPIEPANEELLRLRDALKPFLERNADKFDVKEVERLWRVIHDCERAVKSDARRHPGMTVEIWGHLVGACENVASHATWPKTSKRWITIRRVLLKAANDPLPQADSDADSKDDGRPGWGWPAPRLDAARGLPFLACQLGRADKAIATALRRLCLDTSRALRFNLADRIAVLERPAPDLMWELIEMFLANERKFSVLDALALSAGRLWARAPEKVKPLLQLIADRAMQGASADNQIHTTLAQTHLFQFLRTGDPDCEEFVNRFVAECDGQRASDPLGALLHACREGGWLTAGVPLSPDAHADAVRARTWGFFSRLLKAAQDKLQQHRKSWRQLDTQGEADPEVLKPLRENINRTARLVDEIAVQLYFASGAFEENSNSKKVRLDHAQLCRFWKEAAPLLHDLAKEPHPHTAHHVVQTLHHLLQCAPREVFLLATKAILSGTQGGFQYESLAVGAVVKLIQRALADHRSIFQSDTEQDCLEALLQVLDLFVETGWPEARQLTHRLEEIHR